MNLLRRLSLLAKATFPETFSRIVQCNSIELSWLKYAFGGLVIAIALLTAAIGYAIQISAQEGIQCRYYYTDEDGNTDNAFTSCNSSGYPYSLPIL